MGETGNAEFDESSVPNEPLVLKAQEPEKQDTLLAAVDDLLLETPTASESINTNKSASAIDATALEHISPNAFSNYAVGGVLTNAFAIGDVGASDRFYLIGSPAEFGAQQPTITGVLCDASGGMLCRLERNAIVANPGGCEIVRTNQPGFKVRDAHGKVVLHVQTKRRAVPGIGDSFVSTITGPGVVVDREYAAFGFNDAGVTRHAGLDDLQRIIAIVTMSAGGKHFEPLRGRMDSQTVYLDGKVITDGTEITSCRLVIETGDFVVVPGARFTISNNELDLRGKARNVGILVAGVPR